MAQISLQATEKSMETAAASKTGRLFFIDHLRAALIILVVLYHIAIVYGEGRSFWYVDPPKNAESLGGFALFLFVFFNQAWFMGAFFLLAGYFVPGSYDRKGAGSVDYRPVYLAKLLADVSRIHWFRGGLVPCAFAHLQFWLCSLALVDQEPGTILEGPVFTPHLPRY
jgi:uncharacterized membrane protein